VSCFRFIAAEKANYSISLLCRLLGVSRSGFHAWERRPPSQRALADAELGERIREVHAESRQTYGARRVHAALRRRGIRVSRKRIERLMRRLGLSGHVPTWQGGLYLAAVMDCYSRRIVGWSMRASSRRGSSSRRSRWRLLAVDHGRGSSTIPTRGSQYVSLLFGERCREAGIQLSMDSKGDAYDNAVAESFFASLAKDVLRRRSFRTRQEARTAIFDYIESFYNRTRLHSALGYLPPAEYEMINTEEGRREAA
jgi:putative transposase